MRYIGCSTYPAWKVMEALMVSEQKGYAALPSALHLLDKRRPRWVAGQERPDQRGLPGAFYWRSTVSHKAYGVGPAR